jgi:U4/U6.U5 tri-snRNP component SNU23
MSKAAKDGNNFRREWDKAEFEARAKARLDAELALEAEREAGVSAPQPIVQRAPLQRRTEDLQLAKFVGARTVISGADMLSGQYAGSYYCQVCECSLRDSANYLAHINGKKHNRMLGMSMRAERSTLGEVKARLEAHKPDVSEKDLPPEEKAQRFLEKFDERVRAREEEARQAAAEERRLKRVRRDEPATSSGAGAAGTETGNAVDWVADESEADMAAMMGFGGFGSSKQDS